MGHILHTFDGRLRFVRQSEALEIMARDVKTSQLKVSILLSEQ